MKALLFFLEFVFLFLISIHSKGYTHISPYSYCMNGPVNYIDPTGKDVVVLNYGNDLRHQHIAMLIQDENGDWQYYSINGNNVYVSGVHEGGRPFDDIAVGSWASPEEFLHSTYNERNEDSKENKEKNHFGFVEGYLISTTSEQDATMRDGFIEHSKTEYTPLGNNCATAVQEVLTKAGIEVNNPKYKTIHVPANKHYGEPAYNIIRLNFNTLPSAAFKSIIKVNPGGKYIHK